ncbi:hypothetical protein CJ030_MR4G016099 [Morella rubra]|uniref:Uncharacterized protein n=2 Tax=Morella rubra TaxID=262757 RepID=A0A6A1VZA9_9ROSI|nr:hypothetical protein CJ030_MR4G016099 [Morella rubra]
MDNQFESCQAVAKKHNEKWFNELLDGSLRLLDVGNVARDALLQTKERILEFQSTLRRRRGSRMELAKEVEKYLTCRKVVKKAMQKASQRMQSNFKEKSNDSLPIVTMLKGVEKTTILAFESLLTFMVGTKLQSKSSSWSLVSKLVHPKRVTCEDEEANEFEKLDAALQSLINHKTSQSDSTEQVENVQDCLGELESSIQNFEEALEHLSRRLVKTRVSLLNIFNH